MNNPKEMSDTITIRDTRFRSNLNSMAKNRIKMTHVDFVIVYRLMVMNSNDQLENEISNEDATPVTANFFHDNDQGILILQPPDIDFMTALMRADRKYLIRR